MCATRGGVCNVEDQVISLDEETPNHTGELITTSDSSTLHDTPTASNETEMDTTEGSKAVIHDRSDEVPPVVVESLAILQVVAEPQLVHEVGNQPPGIIVGEGKGEEILTNRNTALNLTNKMPHRAITRLLGEYSQCSLMPTGCFSGDCH